MFQYAGRIGHKMATHSNSIKSKEIMYMFSFSFSEWSNPSFCYQVVVNIAANFLREALHPIHAKVFRVKVCLSLSPLLELDIVMYCCVFR